MLTKILEFQIYWQLYSDHDYKWSHFFSNSEIEVALLSCFGKKYFFYFSCTSNNSEMKPDLGIDQLKGTNKALDTSRLACDTKSTFFSYWSPHFPEEWQNCVQMPYPAAGTRFDCHKHWIFDLARSFGGLIKRNCGSKFPKYNSKYTTLSHWVRSFSPTTASRCLTHPSHIPSRDFNCYSSILNFSPYPGKVNFLVLDILGRAFLCTLAPKPVQCLG